MHSRHRARTAIAVLTQITSLFATCSALAQPIGDPEPVEPAEPPVDKPEGDKPEGDKPEGEDADAEKAAAEKAAAEKAAAEKAAAEKAAKEVAEKVAAAEKAAAKAEAAAEKATAALTKAAEEKAAEEKAAEEQLPLAGYDKGFFIQSPDGNYKLVVAGRVQFRFQYEGAEGEGVANDEVAFSIPRARIQLKGHAFTPDLTFYLQADFGKGALPTLKDAFIDYRLLKDFVQFRAGQMKVPFMRQQIASSTKLNMVDRAITDKAFKGGRDLGVMVHNGFDKVPWLEYDLGFFNGSSDKPVFDEENGTYSDVPDFFNPLLAARLGYNYVPEGEKFDSYDEVDFEGGAPRFGIAGNMRVLFDTGEEGEAGLDVGGDLMFKAHGFSAHGGVYRSWLQDGSQLLENSGLSGVRAEAGYLIAKRFQPGLLYARLMPDDSAENDKQEILAALSAFAFKHNVKAVLDGGVLLEDAPDDTVVDWRIRTQLQLQL